ncbi:MAG: GAF domain-containing protein [bacterium]|nr:GAF domain-containing protein [bacterium]
MKKEAKKTQDIFKTLCEIGKDLSATMDSDELLTKIMEGAKQICDVRADSILLLDKKKEELYFRIALGEKGEEIKKVVLPVGEGIAGWVAKSGQPLIVNDVSLDPRFSKAVDEKTKLKTKSILCVPIKFKEEILGVIEVLNKSNDKEFTAEDLQYLTVLASQAAVALNNSLLMDELHNFFVNTIEILVMAIEAVEPESKGHAVRIARLATAMARQLKFNQKDYEDLYYAALIHDIGKLKIEEPKQFHPIIGAEMVKEIKLLLGTIPLIKSHHEHYDGKGYPEGLKGDMIPVGAGILAIAEDFEEQFLNMRIMDRGIFAEMKKRFLSDANMRYAPEVISAFAEVMILSTDIYDFL